jgi:hypothetical protein
MSRSGRVASTTATPAVKHTRRVWVQLPCFFAACRWASAPPLSVKKTPDTAAQEHKPPDCTGPRPRAVLLLHSPALEAVVRPSWQHHLLPAELDLPYCLGEQCEVPALQVHRRDALTLSRQDANTQACRIAKLHQHLKALWGAPAAADWSECMLHCDVLCCAQLTSPTLCPGWNLVPLCVTSTCPGNASCPSDIFVPRYLGRDPFLFFVEPPCFFVALQQVRAHSAES